MEIEEGDNCPRCPTGKLKRYYQCSTDPYSAYSYLRCDRCGWNNRKLRYEEMKIKREINRPQEYVPPEFDI